MAVNRDFLSTTHNIVATLSGSNAAESFNQLFSCIRKNTVILSFLETIKEDSEKQEKVANLSIAIQEGDPNNAIFDDENCYLYLLYLIKNTPIKFHYGMTIYQYIIHLQQFTSRQNLAEPDLKYKSLRDLTVGKLVDNSTLTDDGIYFLRKVTDKLKEYIDYDCYDELVNYVKTLPPSEQWLTKIPHNADVFPSYNKYLSSGENGLVLDPAWESPAAIGYDAIVARSMIFPTVPYFQMRRLHNSKLHVLLVPSVSIMYFCYKKVAPMFVEPQFLFGATGFDKLHILHSNNKHPVLIYARDVKSNVNKAHNYFCGPAGVTFHDLVHTFWCNLLPFDFKNLIYQFLIPHTREISEIAKKHDDTLTADTINALINEWGDFDLLAKALLPIEQRCSKYIESGFHHPKSIKYGGLQKIGERQNDAILFHMQYLLLQQGQWSKDEINVWEQCISILIKETDHARIEHHSSLHKIVPDNIFSEAIITLAKNAIAPKSLNQTYCKDKAIEWEAWLKIINSTIDSESIWYFANERLKELLILITEYNLVFFHPYLPMTETKRTEFKLFLENQCRTHKEQNEKKQESINASEFKSTSFILSATKK